MPSSTRRRTPNPSLICPADSAPLSSRLTPVRLPAEWEPQSATLLGYPARDSDWAPLLRYARESILALARTIAAHQPVIMLVRDHESRVSLLEQLRPLPYPIWIMDCEFDDTWLRDTGPLTVACESGGWSWLDFRFNGWGNKFIAERDDRLTAALHRHPLFNHLGLIESDQVLEGGAIESDGDGTLMTTSRCMRARKVDFSRAYFESLFARTCGVEQVLWLDHGELIGDDTDSHIDMFARFGPDNALIFQGCQNPSDPHWPFFAAMAEQLATFRNRHGQPYRLFELPMPERLGRRDHQQPASYANFLIINGAVLMPSYGSSRDDAARRVLGQCFADHRIIPVDSRTLISQGGALHCASMQLPAEVLYVSA